MKMNRTYLLLFAGLACGIRTAEAETGKRPLPAPSISNFMTATDTAIDNKRLAAWQKEFDVDGDGKLSPEESAQVKATVEKRQADRASIRATLIAKFDADKNGKLDDAELVAATEFLVKQRAYLLKEFDKDGDGKLAGDELAKACKMVRDRFLAENPAATKK